MEVAANCVAAIGGGHMAVAFGKQRIFALDRNAQVQWSKSDPVARGMASCIAVTNDGARAVIGTGSLAGR